MEHKIVLNCLYVIRVGPSGFYFSISQKYTQIMVILPKIQFNLFSLSPPRGNFSWWLYIKLEEIFSVSARSSMLQGGRVETAVVPIISSATNIRDYYVRQLALMK